MKYHRNRPDPLEPPSMTLRDRFAAAAMEGLIAYPHPGEGIKLTAETAYRYADQMLKARKLSPSNLKP